MRKGIQPNDVGWAAYENQDFGHADMGRLKFLVIGPDQTFKEAPKTLPDTQSTINWRYQHVGWVDLEKGIVVESQ